MIVTCNRPWLAADLGAPHRVMSWAVHNGGITTARRILWREVRNADLPEGRDVERWLAGEVTEPEAVCLLTSRDVTRHVLTRAEVEGITAEALTTAGLSNAEAVGARRDWQAGDWGTINIAVQIHAHLTQSAQIEALSIATQARTAAVIDCALRLPTGMATGTGTDCIALAALPGPDHRHAGLHTALGEAVGAAVRRGVARAAAEWVADWEALGRLKPGRGL
ncbi:adenosylcobinamide amidohydrolase [Paenirhodobacter sp.]|uniref:adenosylcobinamide amidohydrolase n=1 Tax=Paenirhodobacter sp. TaxID=1965326 RepID=UPI003B3CC24E